MATPSFSEKSLVCRMRGRIQKRIPMLACSNQPNRLMFVCSMRTRGMDRYSISPTVGTTNFSAVSNPHRQRQPEEQA